MYINYIKTLGSNIQDRNQIGQATFHKILFFFQSFLKKKGNELLSCNCLYHRMDDTAMR